MDYGIGEGLLMTLSSSVMCFAWLVPIVVAAASLVVWVVALADVLQRAPQDFPNVRQGYADPNERLIWMLLVIVLGTLGALLYYLMVMRRYPRAK